MSPRLHALLSMDTRELFGTYGEVTASDTDFAGRTAETYTRRMFTSGFEPLLSDDPVGSTQPRAKVQVLFGDGTVRDLDPAAPELDRLRR